MRFFQALLEMGDRLMVGRLTLDQLIGVRLPVPQVYDTGNRVWEIESKKWEVGSWK